MKYATILLVASMFVAIGAAQPMGAGPEMAENMTNQSDQVAPEQPEVDNGTGAQFDARLQTAIMTLDALTEIAPTEEAKTGIENALSTLKEVQNSTETESLGPDRDKDRDRNRNQETNQDRDRDRNRAAGNATGKRGPPEDAGPKNKGPSENSNRPGFVESLLGGIFG